MKTIVLANLSKIFAAALIVAAVYHAVSSLSTGLAHFLIR